MKGWRFILICSLAMALAGCGVNVKESLKVPSDSRQVIGEGTTIVILPFADYTDAGNMGSAFSKNLLLTENLTDKFVQLGFYIPVQDDVFAYLVQKNIIRTLPKHRTGAGSIQGEMGKDWSPDMKHVLQSYEGYTQKDVSDSKADKWTSNSLTRQEIMNIGRHFSADYIVRGRILQFKNRHSSSWNPMQRGAIPFVVGTTEQFTLGETNMDSYDILKPFDFTNDGIDQDKSGPVFGDIPEAAVQVRIWIQDAHSGEIVWTNRMDIKVSAATFWGDSQKDILFESAAKEAAGTLVNDFAHTVYGMPLPPKQNRKDVHYYVE